MAAAAGTARAGGEEKFEIAPRLLPQDFTKPHALLRQGPASS
jgi:hypothetical protein